MGSSSSKEDDTANNGGNPFSITNRKCTDILCLIFFLIFWVGMLAIAGVGFAQGQPEKLVYGVDWRGRTCGTKASEKGEGDSFVPAYDLSEYKYLLYPRLSEDLFDIQMSGKPLNDPKNLKRLFGVCVKECPNPRSDANKEQYAHAYLDYGKNPEPVNSDDAADKEIENTDAGSPWLIALNTTDVFFRCLDLGQVNSTAFARCVDPCENGETKNCGESLSTNPYHHCGHKGCENYIEDTFPKCRTAETQEIIDKKGAARSSPLYDQLNSGWQLIARWLGDLEKSALPIIVCGGIVALILGFVLLLLLRSCAGVFVWLSILLVVLMMFVVSIYAAYKGEIIHPDTVSSALEKAGVGADKIEDMNTYIDEAGFRGARDRVKYWEVAAYILFVADALLVCTLCFLCSRIKIAIGIIREASKAVQCMPFMIFFPIWPSALILALVIYWVVTAAFIATSGKIELATLEDKYAQGKSFGLSEYSDNNIMNYMLLYHLFGLLWTNQFIQAIGYIVIAGAVCEYYWTLDKSTIKGAPVFRSLKRTLRYHLGSLAFGSLIIAIVQMMRLVLEYIDQRTKKAQEGNKVVKMALYCCKCFLWCFEQCLKFINRNAYILVAMKGVSFCTAMKEAFQLLLANAARVATVGIISTFLLFLSKLFIVAFSICCMFVMIEKPPKDMPSFFMGDIGEVSSPLFPMAVTALLAYAVATFFMGVYETAIDTILLCFCEDCKVNQTTGNYYMSDELLSYVDGAAKKNAFRHYKEEKSENQV